jgi:hypothetical protein
MLNWLKRHPQTLRSDVYHALRNDVRWLWTNDQEWLMCRLPDKKSSPRTDYDAIRKRKSEKLKAKDERIASQVPIIKQVLVSQPGRPKRVTAARILVALGIPNGLGSSRKVMKLTRTALAKYSESIPECAVRRILWNVKEAKRTGKYWNPTSLWSATGRKLEWIKDPAVARAVAFAVRELGLSRTELSIASDSSQRSPGFSKDDHALAVDLQSTPQ